MLAASLVMAAGAGGCNAISSVLQRKANLAEPAERSGVRLIGDLVRRGPWLLSILAMIVSFLLQAAALDVGTLAAVEPVLAIELPLTLVFAAWLLHRPLRRRAMVAGAVMAAGLAAFVVGLDPSDGDAARVGNAPALLALVGTGALIAPMSVIARLGPAGSRAALFGVAAGACFGLTASLVKMAVARLSSGGVAGLLSAWPTYTFIVTGVTAVLLVQTAMHTGTLVAVQPGLTLVDPLVSLLWGTVLLGEATRRGPILLVAVAGAAAVVASVFALAHTSHHGRGHLAHRHLPYRHRIAAS